MPWLLSDEALELLRGGLSLRGSANEQRGVATYAAPSVVAGTMEISIDGILTPEPDPWVNMLYGANTSYSEIVRQMAEANADKSVKRIRLMFGRVPGGDAMGVFAAMDAIAGSDKPVEAFVKYQATSGGYGLASQAGKITVADRGVVLGSVGVAMDLHSDPEQVSITSTEAPDKRPDVSTEEGRETIRKELDELHELFVASIAKGRGIKVADVNANYGRGGLVMAERALSLGMIDKIEARRLTGAKNAGGKKVEDEKTFEMGVLDERARVLSHLELAAMSGDYERALSDVRSGSAVTVEVSKAHVEAGIKSRAVNARAADAAPVITPANAETDSFEARCLRAYENRMEV